MPPAPVPCDSNPNSFFFGGGAIADSGVRMGPCTWPGPSARVGGCHSSSSSPPASSSTSASSSASGESVVQCGWGSAGMRERYGAPTDSPSDSSCIAVGEDGGPNGGDSSRARRWFSACQCVCGGGGGGRVLREGGEDASGCRGRLLRATPGGGCKGPARREAERPRVQEPGAPGWATKRVAIIGDAEAGPGALDATRADANAVARSAASEISEMETVREREGPARRSCGIPPPLMPELSPALSATALRASTPSMLTLFLRPRCRSRSIPRHISSVTPKRSRQRRSWRARESGRVSGLWQMAHGEGWPPWRAVLLRWRERSRGVPNWRLQSVHLYLASGSVSCTIIRDSTFFLAGKKGEGLLGRGGEEEGTVHGSWTGSCIGPPYKQGRQDARHGLRDCGPVLRPGLGPNVDARTCRNAVCWYALFDPYRVVDCARITVYRLFVHDRRGWFASLSDLLLWWSRLEHGVFLRSVQNYVSLVGDLPTVVIQGDHNDVAVRLRCESSWR
ncbi:hypothetical protein EDB83DRAFT_1613348 [Lactarius deliciosus]|nr:hypothetical protein EDB83DRAFT_1613348 [Lactarius deliciosus]